MTARSDRLFCDTNVLLCAVDSKRALNQHALRVLNTLPNQGVELCVSGQVIREFLAVSTRPAEANGLGLGVRQAIDNAHAILERSTILEEPRGMMERLLRLVAATRISGRRVHDANIVAVMLENGVQRLVTDNLVHFRCFDQIELMDLSTL